MTKKSIVREILYLLLFLLLAFLFFYRNWSFSYLRTDDTVLWQYEAIKTAIKNGTPYMWNNSYFKLPSVDIVTLHPRLLLLALLPISVFIQSSIMLHIFIFGYGMFLFLRQKGLSTAAAIIGGIVLMFTNNFVTLIMAGHLGKFETYAYFPLVLYFLSLATDKSRVRDYLFAGASLGIAFMGGALDVASYFAVFVTIYFLYMLIKKKNDLPLKDYIKQDYKNIILSCLKFALVVVFSFTLSIQAIMHTRTTTEQGAVGVTNDSELWDWATRWSYPPEEVISFILPGFFGSYTGSDTSPYWGRTARMDGDEPTFNYSLVITNISMLAFMFILFAMIASRKQYKQYGEKYFWLASALFFILASFGRYFPIIFKIIFSIPIFQSARNPNKFLDVAVIPIAVLAAYGVDYLLNIYKAKKEGSMINMLGEGSQYQKIVVVKAIVFCFAIFFAVISVVTILFQSTIYSKFATNFGHDGATLIAQNIFLAFLRATFLSTSIALIIKNLFSFTKIKTLDKLIVFVPLFLFVLSSILIGKYLYNVALLIFLIIAFALWFYFDSNRKININRLAFVFATIIVLDLFESAAEFIQKNNVEENYRSNRITDTILNDNADDNNNTLVMPLNHPYINVYLTHKMPALGIRLVDPPAASRMDKNIEAFFNAFAINDYFRYQPRLYSILGVKYYLAPGDINTSMFYNDLTFIDAYQDNYSIALLYKINNAAPRFEYITKTYKASNIDEAMSIMTTKEFDYKNEAVVYDEGYEYLNIANNNAAEDYTVKIIEEKPNLIKANVRTTEQGMLVLKDFYSPDWKVFVDGLEKPLVRVNGILRGVALESGDFEVVYEYQPKMIYFYSSLISYILLLIIIILASLIFYFRKPDVVENK